MNNCTCATCVHQRVAAVWRALTPLPARLLCAHSCARPWARGVLVVRWGFA